MTSRVRAEGLFTTRLYTDDVAPEDIAAGHAARRPVWAIAPESNIVMPAPDTVLAVDEPVAINGWAWSFHGIDAVEISTDSKASFRRTALEPRRGWAWRKFPWVWQPSARGEAQIFARAIEAGGLGQPRTGARNAMHSVRVFVR